MGKMLQLFPQAPPGLLADASPTLDEVLDVLRRINPPALSTMTAVGLRLLPTAYRKALTTRRVLPRTPAEQAAHLQDAIRLLGAARATRKASVDRALQQCIAEMRQRRRALLKAAR